MTTTECLAAIKAVIDIADADCREGAIWRPGIGPKILTAKIAFKELTAHIAALEANALPLWEVPEGWHFDSLFLDAEQSGPAFICRLTKVDAANHIEEAEGTGRTISAAWREAIEKAKAA